MRLCRKLTETRQNDPSPERLGSPYTRFAKGPASPLAGHVIHRTPGASWWKNQNMVNFPRTCVPDFCDSQPQTGGGGAAPRWRKRCALLSVIFYRLSSVVSLRIRVNGSVPRWSSFRFFLRLYYQFWLFAGRSLFLELCPHLFLELCPHLFLV